jgi:hypothetical protein
LVLYSYVYFARFKITFQKNLRIRDRKLKRIKRRLAILRIKNILSRESISIKSLKLQIKKYKRRLTLSLNAGKSLKTDENGSQDDAESNQTELERIAQMKLAIEQEDARREKIKLGKISYKVPKFKFLNLIPRIKPQSSSSRSSSSENSMKLYKKPGKVTPQPKIAIKVDRFQHIQSNYMAITKSVENRVKGPKWLLETNEESPRPKPSRRAITLYSPTQFSLQKINPKKLVNKNNKPSWNISPTVTESYTPSIFSQNEKLSFPEIAEARTSKSMARTISYNKKERLNCTKTVYQRKFRYGYKMNTLSFEEALPELANITKMYEKGMMTGMLKWKFEKLRKN